MKHIGKSYPIHDAAAKATGRAIYAGDMNLPGMLHLAVLFSPIPHGIVKSVDPSRALGIPGVVDVLHCLDTDANPFNRYRFFAGDEAPEQDEIFNRHVRFIGDRVGCVVAESPELAREALDLIKVEYEELPFTTDMHEARDTGVLEGVHGQGAVYGDYVCELGERSCEEPGDVVTETFSSLSRISHVTMEPHACVASYDKSLDELTVWSPCQSVYGIRTVLGDIFSMPYHKIRVVKTTMGGSFGAKQEWMLEPVAAAAALRTGRPVKLVYTRAEAMVSTICRCPLEAAMASRFSKDGKIKSFDIDVTVDAGAYLGNSYTYAVTISNKLYRIYDIPHSCYTGRAVITNSPVSGAFRGWGTPELYIILEHNLNMAARKLGLDPLELRLRNLLPPEGFDQKYERSVGPLRIRECLEQGRELFGWDRLRLETREFNSKGGRFLRGIGVGCGGHVNGYYPRRQDFAAVEMRLDETGGAYVNISLHDHGCGTVTAFRMIVAETLGLPIDMVYIKEADTGVTPFDLGCYASRSVYVLGGAAAECAEKLKQLVIETAAALENADPGELFCEDGCVRSKADPAFCRTFAQVSLAALRTQQRELRVTHQMASQSNPTTCGAHFAYIEADTYTGMVKLLDYVAVHDIGRVINREICIGQIQGAVLMGAGAALSEHCDIKTGGVPTSSLKDYHVLNAADTPPIRVGFIEDGGTDGPFGAKSIGEVSHVPVAPAIVAAVNDALGSGMCDLPLCPDRIVRLMRERRAAK